MKTLKKFISEVTQPEKVSVVLGRFSPFHISHSKIIEMMKYKPIVLLVKGTGSSEDKEKNPFDEKYQEYLIKKVFPNVKVIVVKNANLAPIRFHLEKSGEYQIAEIIAGPDRLPSYKSQLKDFADRIEFTETPRATSTDSDRTASATAVREAIRSENEAEFKKLMPRQLWGEWDTMVQKLKQES